MPIIIKNLSALESGESLVHLFEPYGEINVYQLGQDVGIEITNGDSVAAEQRAAEQLQNVEFQGQHLELEWVEVLPDDSFSVDLNQPSGEPASTESSDPSEDTRAVDPGPPSGSPSPSPTPSPSPSPSP